MRKFYDIHKQDGIIYEGRVSGDGESLDNEEFFEKSRCPSWERMPGDGCISDIAEEDEDAEEDKNCGEEEIDEDEDGFDEENFDDDFDNCDESDEGEMTWYFFANTKFFGSEIPFNKSIDHYRTSMIYFWPLSVIEFTKR